MNGSALNTALRNDLMIGGKRATFYTKDAIFKHRTVLVNPYHFDELFEKVQATGLVPEDAVIFADSGGLQEITLQDVKHKPQDVFAWQQKHTNIGFSVDSLPFITGNDDNNKSGSFGGWMFDAKGFIDHANISKQNIEVTKKFRDRVAYPNFSFYGIIQGRKYSEYKQWYDVIRDDEYLDGYCVKAPNVNPITLAETCMFVMENLTKPVHFLGIGNISRSIVIYYANKYIKQPITFDSSSYDIGAQFRSYLLPFMMNKKLRFVSDHNLGEDSTVVNENDIVNLENANDLCDCNVCRAIGDKLGGMIKSNTPLLGVLLSVHNITVQTRFLNYIKTIINSPYKLNEFIEASFEPALAEKIKVAFAMIDDCHERGSSYVLQKYGHHMQINKEAGKQASVFGF